MAQVEVKNVNVKITSFSEKPKKKKKRRRSIGHFFITFFITLIALFAAGLVMLILASEQLQLNIPGLNGNWFFGQTASNSQHSAYTYGLVQESAAVEDSYFDDAVFVGDSLTHGMRAYKNRLGRSYGVVGISVSDALWRDRYTLDNGSLGTAVDAATQGNPGKIYLMFGTNGVNYMSDYTPIIEDYTILIQHIRQKCPNAAIYVQSIPPVTQGYSIAYPRLKPKYIQAYNQMLLKMTEEQNCYFLDSNSVLSTESGHLPQMYTSDSGLHLNTSAYEVMFDYLKRHTVKK